MRSMWGPLTLVAALSSSPLAAQGAQPGLEITFERNSEAERATADQLRRILQKYDVDQWIYTRRVHIDERAIPHSHPVLTLHTRQRGDDLALLATFLHEQFHWLEEGNEHFREAMRLYGAKYPDAPPRGPEGGRDLESTYRHLLVCDLEFQAMSHLVGEDRAREVLSANRYYTWIYERVLHDPSIREIARGSGFLLGGEGDSSRGIVGR